jgi:hypothetical protein
MYYVKHKQENLIQTTIHLGTHDHLVAKGHSREGFYQVKSLVKKEASHTFGAIALAIALVASINFLSKHQLNEDGEGLVEVLKGNVLCLVTDKFIVLSSPHIQNLVASFKHRLGNRRYVSSIFIIKACMLHSLKVHMVMLK